jgi:hypothetical protein
MESCQNHFFSVYSVLPPPLFPPIQCLPAWVTLKLFSQGSVHNFEPLTFLLTLNLSTKEPYDNFEPLNLFINFEPLYFEYVITFEWMSS